MAERSEMATSTGQNDTPRSPSLLSPPTSSQSKPSANSESRKPGRLMTQTTHQSQRKGSKSPSSIPSSPTSVHSSSSAIFERDIEHVPSIALPPPHPHPHPHTTTSSTSTQPQGTTQNHPHPSHNALAQLQIAQMKSRESAVPSVLSSAIELLSDTSLPSITHSNESSPKAALSNISVISPATAVGGGGGLFGMSGVSRMASRSPSPTRTSFVYTTTGPIPPLSSSSTAGTVSGYGSGSGSPRPHPERSATLSSMTTTSGTLSAGGTAASSPRMSPTLLSPIVPDAPPTSPNPLSLPPSISSLSSLPPSSLPSSSVASSPPTAHPSLASEPSARSPAPANPGTGSTYPTPSTIHKRLSFLSYTDLLSSTPSTSIPLSSLVSPTSSDPPPHISALSGISASSNASIAGDWDERSINGGFGGAGGGGGGMGAGGYGGGGSTYGAGMEEVDKFGMSLDVGGGEWEREGFGRGLEERLERLLSAEDKPLAGPTTVGAAASPAIAPVVPSVPAQAH